MASRPTSVKKVNIGRNCSLTIIKRDNQWHPYSVVTYNGSGYGAKDAISLSEARSIAAAEARRLRRTRACKRR